MAAGTDLGEGDVGIGPGHAPHERGIVRCGYRLVVTGVEEEDRAMEHQPFQAQVPDWVPLGKDATVLASGIAEIALGSTLILTDEKHQEVVGKLAVGFFVAVFPGNISQYIHRRNAFGLDTDRKRFVRLFFQPALVYWALKSTGKGRTTLSYDRVSGRPWPLAPLPSFAGSRGSYSPGRLLVKKSSRLCGESSAKISLWSASASKAADALRGKRSFS